MKAKKETKGSDTPGADEDQEDLDEEECSITENTLETKPKIMDSSLHYPSNQTNLNSQQINNLSDSSAAVVGSNVTNQNMNQVSASNSSFNMQHMQPILS